MNPNQPPQQPEQTVPSAATQPHPGASMPQGHAAGAPKPKPPEPPPTLQPTTPTSQPAPMTPPPASGGGKMKMIIIALVIILVLAVVGGIAAFALTSGGGNSTPIPEPTGDVGPRDHEATEFPEFQGVEETANTVFFNKVDESFQIKYLDEIYHEQDTGEFTPRLFEPVPEASGFAWYPMINPPEEALDDGSLFSFKAPATYQSFVYIMRWDDSGGERYYMYRFQNNQVSLLREFTETRLFYAPVIDDFSLGGNFVSINLFTCPTCFDETPEVLLYEISTGNVKNLGQVSHFAWGNDDKSYEYKEYQEGVDPATQTLRKNEFFSESVDILDP